MRWLFGMFVVAHGLVHMDAGFIAPGTGYLHEVTAVTALGSS